MSTSYTLAQQYRSDFRLTHYSNGRRLMAADLTADQQAALARAQWVARAAGWGIVEGLTVTLPDSARLRDRRAKRLVAGTAGERPQAVIIAPGLAINRLGEPVAHGPAALTIHLAQVVVAPAPPPTDPATDPATDAFTACDDYTGYPGIRPAPLPPAPPVALADGVYVLTARPAVRQVAGLVQYAESGLGQCDIRWDEYGVEFRLVRLDKLSLSAADAANASLARNQIAAWCFDHAAQAAILSNPFGPASFRLDKRLDEAGVEPADVPLAVVVWHEGGVALLDHWPVRRRVVQPHPATHWESLSSDRMAASGEARFYQFQDHLAALSFEANPSVLDLFRWLPPVGYLPVRGLRDKEKREPVEPVEPVRPVPPLTDPAAPREGRGILLRELSLDDVIVPLVARLQADERVSAQDAAMAAALVKDALVYAAALQPAAQSRQLIDLASFWLPYAEEFGEKVVEVKIIDPHGAVRLLHDSWHDSAIDLGAGEPVTVYLVLDTDRLWRLLRMLLDPRQMPQQADPRIETLRERWHASPLAERMVERQVIRDPSPNEPPDLTPLYAVFGRQELVWSAATRQPNG